MCLEHIRAVSSNATFNNVCCRAYDGHGFCTHIYYVYFILVQALHHLWPVFTLHALHCTLSEMLRAECAPEICSQANVTFKMLLKVTFLHVLHLICAWKKTVLRCIGYYIFSALCSLYLLLQYGIYIKAYGCILLDTHFCSSSKRISLLPIRTVHTLQFVAKTKT